MPKNAFRKTIKALFVATNVFFALLFILACNSKWFDPVRHWFIGLVTLVSSYLLIILFIFFIFWLIIRSKWAFIFIILLICEWQPINNIIPFRLPYNFEIKKQDSSLRIMSWNVEQFEILHSTANPGLRQQMFDLINTYQPDIACFQEMVCADSAIKLDNVYERNYYHKFGLYFLNDFINGLHFPYNFYAYNYKENYLWREHFGIIIFSKYPIINKHIVEYYPYDYNSIFEYADILKGDDTVRVFNIHLQSLHFSPSNLQYIDSPSLHSEQDIKKTESVLSKFKTGFLKRQAEADRISAEIDKSPYPVVLCGDFNDVPNSYAYETIGKGLQNAFVQKGYGLGRTFSGISSTLRIDNIFLDNHFSVQQFTRIHKRLIDHFPIITDVKIAQ